MGNIALNMPNEFKMHNTLFVINKFSFVQIIKVMNSRSKHDYVKNGSYFIKIRLN